MRIIVNPFTGSTQGSGQELTGNTPQCTVRGLGGACEWNDQINRFIGAPSANFQDRGNIINHLDFEVTRFWPSAAQAALFDLTHPDTVPHIATVQFLILMPNMNVAQTLAVQNVAIKVARVKWEGSMTVMQYHFQCGAITL